MKTYKRIIANQLCSGRFLSSHRRATPFIVVELPCRRVDRVGRVIHRAFQESF